jgi:hypothetical protein
VGRGFNFTFLTWPFSLSFFLRKFSFFPHGAMLKLKHFSRCFSLTFAYLYWQSIFQH